jgi:hypothetical protein
MCLLFYQFIKFIKLFKFIIIKFIKGDIYLICVGRRAIHLY